MDLISDPLGISGPMPPVVGGSVHSIERRASLDVSTVPGAIKRTASEEFTQVSPTKKFAFMTRFIIHPSFDFMVA